MDMLELMKQRHSVRQYEDKAIEPEKREVLDKLISDINKEKGLHIQIFYDEPKCFESKIAHYGNFVGVKNYICLVGRKSTRLDETLGYYGEKIVLKAQELGLNTCWVALSHGKSNANIGRGEKQVCIIALGYGKSNGFPHKNKSMKRLCNYKDALPDWFIKGMDAAMLAPTALNQQKFFIELQSDGTVWARAGSGFYTKIDLGIVKYHFEIGSQKRIL